MTKKLFWGGFFLLAIACSQGGYAADQDNNPALNQARSDYRQFLQELKKLNQEYKQVSSEINKVVQEEGLPSWDENTGEVNVKKQTAAKQETKKVNFGIADVREMEDEIIVTMDLPGVEKNQIKISIENGRFLHVQGSREALTQEKKAGSSHYYQKIERLHGDFDRLIELPVPVDDEDTEAEYENGILTVTMPKLSETKKEVKVNIA